jgi:hypothetical protein
MGVHIITAPRRLERRWPTKEKKGLQTAFYYKDPDHNIVELNVNNYDDEWTARREASLTPDCSISLYRSPPAQAFWYSPRRIGPQASLCRKNPGRKRHVRAESCARRDRRVGFEPRDTETPAIKA